MFFALGTIVLVHIWHFRFSEYFFLFWNFVACFVVLLNRALYSQCRRFAFDNEAVKKSIETLICLNSLRNRQTQNKFNSIVLRIIQDRQIDTFAHKAPTLVVVVVVFALFHNASQTTNPPHFFSLSFMIIGNTRKSFFMAFG